MAFCPNCGAAVDGRFCAKCGTAIPAGAEFTAFSTPPPSSPQAAAAGMTNNVAGALCYALGFITGILGSLWSGGRAVFSILSLLGMLTTLVVCVAVAWFLWRNRVAIFHGNNR